MNIILNFFFITGYIYYLHLNLSYYFTLKFNLLIYSFYISYVSIWFLFFMNIILLFTLFLLTKRIISNLKYSYLSITFLTIFLLVSFIIILEDFLGFIILFESIFFPIYFLCLFFNFNNRFIFAIYLLILFSSFSSILCIVVSFLLLFHFNLLNISLFIHIMNMDSIFIYIYIWLLLFIIFSIKYPIWPLHGWLPEVHVEVTTELSVIFASIILKIGFFGLFKFVFLLFNFIGIWFLGCINTIILLGLIFISFNIIFLVDYKKIIAHWSIIHTGIGLILIWHNDILFTGTIIFCNIGHILSSSFMFIFIGFMYDNYGLRLFLILVSFFGVSIWSSLFLGLFLFNIDFPFMLLFYIDLFIIFGLINLSLIYIIYFSFIIIIVFLSSIYIYIMLSYYSFIWLDVYIRLDLSINDIFVYFIIANITLILYYFIYFIF